MTQRLVLGVLEIIAILSCTYGLYFMAQLGSILGLTYKGLWFILGFISNVCGVIALFLEEFKDDDESEEVPPSQYFVQYHYLLAWLTIVIGYPTFVTQTWLTYYPSPFVYLHLVLSLLPMISWVLRKTSTIVRMTQVTMVLAILSHLYITFLVESMAGMLGAGLMIVNVIALSLPTRLTLWSFTSRELYVIGLAVTSYLFCLTVHDATLKPRTVTNVFPMIGK